jgi:hypothetical protein
MAKRERDEEQSARTREHDLVRRILQEVFGQWRWLIAIIPLTITIVLGGWGFSEYSLDGNPPLSFPDNLYQTLLLFFFASGSVTGPLPWPLEVARWMAPALLTWATIKAILFLVRKQILLFRLRTWRDHVLLVGAKDDVERLPGTFTHAQRSLILDTESDLDDVVTSRDDDTPVLAAQLGSNRMMRALGIHHARYTLLMDREDDANIANALRIRAYLKTHPHRREPLQCFIHISDPETEWMLAELPEFRDESPGFEARFFNVNRNAARCLFERHAPDLCRPITSASDPPAHILLIGNGEFGRHVIHQAFRTGHYRNDQPQVISIVDTDARRQEVRLRGMFENIDALADLRFVECDAGGLRSVELAAIEGTVPFSVVYIAAGGDRERMHLAMRLREKVDTSVRIVACLKHGGGVSEVFIHRTGIEHKGRIIDLFPIAEQMHDGGRIVSESLDRLAKAVHHAFLLKYSGQSCTTEPWHALPLDKRDSNRFQADHLPVKLRAVGLEVHPWMQTVRAHVFSTDEIEIMARMEHRRWISDKILAGYTYGIPANGAVQDAERKIHSLMIPYEDLPDNEQEKDRDAVRLIPELLALDGKLVHATPASRPAGQTDA